MADEGERNPGPAKVGQGATNQDSPGEPGGEGVEPVSEAGVPTQRQPKATGEVHGQRRGWRGACLIDLENPTDSGIHRIRGRQTKLGRLPSCDIVLDRKTVSREHATLEVQEIRASDGPSEEGGQHHGSVGYQVVLRDDKSLNGTYVNDRRITRAVINDGDQLWIGHAMFKFLCGDNLENRYHILIRNLASSDALTGLMNRRSFESKAQEAYGHARREGSPLSMIALDIDHFKRCNDNYGHHAGDQVLVRLAQRMRDVVGPGDYLCRLGGEEFAVICPGRDLAAAAGLAEQLRAEIEAAAISYDDRQITVTVSAGVAGMEPAVGSHQELLNLADERLYRAKAQGRNRIVAFARPRQVSSLHRLKQHEGRPPQDFHP